jgi:CRP-like cAMP-binding protein
MIIVILLGGDKDVLPIPPLHQIVRISYEWFAGLPEGFKALMLARAQQRALASGERLYARGEPTDGFFGVVKGSIRVSGISVDQRETVLDFYGPGSWIGEVSMLDGLPRTHDANAHGDAIVLHIRSGDMEELMAAHPELSRAVAALLALRLRILLMALEQYSVQSLEQRLASRLLMLAGPYGVTAEKGIRIELHLPQEILAQLIGATRQRVNQILKMWESEFILEQQYGRILLLDQSKLESIIQPK